MNVPVAGDPLYGRGKSPHSDRIPLHCHAVRFRHPVGDGGEEVEGRAAVPAWWRKYYPQELVDEAREVGNRPLAD